MIKTGIISATITESATAIDSDLSSTLIITSDTDCMISINDNLHYQLYKSGEMLPLQDRKGTFDNLYCKSVSGTSIVRYWLM